MHQSGGKIKPVFRQFLPYFSIIQPFQILIERFQKFQIRHWENIDAWIFQMWQILRLPNLLNSTPTGSQIIYHQRKRLKKVEESSFLILNYFRKSSLLISTFTWPVDYRNQENHCKGPFFFICVHQSGSKTLTILQ